MRPFFSHLCNYKEQKNLKRYIDRLMENCVQLFYKY